MSVRNKIWFEKYRPKSFLDYIFHNAQHKKLVAKIIQTKELPHLLLSGIQGTGKTSLYKVILTELNIHKNDILKLNASDENSVDVMREKIKNFISTEPFESEYKVVVLEEASYLTLSAQEVLKDYMEFYASNARFILTCNYESKIIPGIQSRCQHLQFKALDKDDIYEMLATILVTEKIKFELEDLDTHIDAYYPDIRRMINSIQQFSIEGKLRSLRSDDEKKDYKDELLQYIEVKDWISARTVATNNTSMDEWENLYKHLYDNLHTLKRFKDKGSAWEQAIVNIAEYLYRHATISHPEINFTACLIALCGE